jgi:hypothetical protein
MTVPVIDYAALASKELAVLEADLGGLSSLERVLSWGRGHRPARVIDEILTQDEYTHDVVVAVNDGRYLVFDTT